MPAILFSVAAPGAERIDRFLADQLSLSRTQAARLVAAGAVTINGKVVRASRLPEYRELVEVAIPEHEPPRTIVPNPLELVVVYEDDDLAVIDKPAGLVVHPAPGHWDDTLVNALVARGTTLSGGAAGRPGIVHRLDRDTSGLMVIAKTDLAHRRLGHALAARQIRRAYAVLSWGHFDQSPTVIEAPLGRSPTDRKRMVVRGDGRAARTDVFVLARFAVADLLRAELHSGRTHQIRVHLAHVGHPVVGDPVYGGGGARRITGPGRQEAERLDRATPRQALHAAELLFRHPVSGKRLAFRSEWPGDLVPALQMAHGSEGQVAPPRGLTYFGFFKYGTDD
ncbi:MAG TPA: RluA family pseudouridine synthase [Gemmatimonadales bacterium]